MAKVKTDSRICFGLEWYDDEEEADRRAREVFEQGRTYWGGFFHGKPCGREKAHDYTDKDGRRLYAVSM